MNVDLAQINCCSCGVLFFITQAHQNHLRSTKETFHCPNGHSQSYNRNEADRLKDVIISKNLEISTLRTELLQRELKKKRRNKKHHAKS